MCWQISRYLLPLSDGAVCEVRLLWREVADSHICFFQVCQILFYFFFIETALVDNPEDSSGEVSIKYRRYKDDCWDAVSGGVGCGNAAEGTGFQKRCIRFVKVIA